MEVITAKTAGFCFGVERAVDICLKESEKKTGPIYTYGPIIHNEEVVKDLERRGILVLHSREELEAVKEGTIIIRSHGAPREIYRLIEERGLKMADATCPFVLRIHRIVQEHSEAGDQIVVIGNSDHPEVKGICGWSLTKVTVISSEEEAREFHRIPGKRVCIVSQTTFNARKFDLLVEILAEMLYDNYVILNTVCNATEERQSEAAKLAEKADAMLVLGSATSSNTQKLYEICLSKCDRTFYIQTLADLDIRLLPSLGCVGITAGASTPKKFIEEVSKQCQK